MKETASWQESRSDSLVRRTSEVLKEDLPDGPRAFQLPLYTTKELSKKTWRDFEKLFSQGNGWDHCQCMHFHRPSRLPKNKQLRTRAERAVRNHREKRKLVDSGCSHGILVYAKGGEPVGWCQYGPREELSRIDNNSKYRGLALEAGTQRLWRITCFAVLKNHRQHGVASAALKAALDSIRKKGGGLVEAYPITRWESCAFGNESTHGTRSMFKREGFKLVAPLSTTRFSSSVLMRRTV
jgi:GNAT superfamily N-acetyltransferase